MWGEALENAKPRGVPEPASLVSFTLAVEEDGLPPPRDPPKSFSEAEEADASPIMLVYPSVCPSFPSRHLHQKRGPDLGIAGVTL